MKRLLLTFIGLLILVLIKTPTLQGQSLAQDSLRGLSGHIPNSDFPKLEVLDFNNNQFIRNNKDKDKIGDPRYRFSTPCYDDINDIREGIMRYGYHDRDGDGYGSYQDTFYYCDLYPIPKGFVYKGGDCNDSNPNVYPRYWYNDRDGDGYGSGRRTKICSGPTLLGKSRKGGDCDDGNRNIHTPATYYLDSDGDGFGRTEKSKLCSTTPPSGYVTNNQDCNDSDRSINPNTVWYRDRDGNGKGDRTTTKISCTQPSGYVLDASDYYDICGKSDHSELVKLYNATNGDNWNDSWDLTKPMSTWHGVILTDDGCSVKRISLNSNGLNGQIPNLDLPNLNWLQLNGNQLSGSIPDFYLPNLKFLSLVSNQLSGQIPNFYLPELEWLDLNDNQLSGRVPNFDRLPNMTWLNLDNNKKLSGSIPNFDFPNLGELGIRNNKFTFQGIAENLDITTYNYENQDAIPIYQEGNKLYVKAGGDTQNNTYRWFKDDVQYKTIAGDSLLIATEPGVYYCMVTNHIFSQAGPVLESYSTFVKKGEIPNNNNHRSQKKSKLLGIQKEFLSQSLNEGFSGGEKKRNEIFQLLMMNPKLAILDETDSGLEIDALKVVSQGINEFRNEENAVLIITHYQRLLNYIVPDYVHVLNDGKILKYGDCNLALALEKKGYDWIKL